MVVVVVVVGCASEKAAEARLHAADSLLGQAPNPSRRTGPSPALPSAWKPQSRGLALTAGEGTAELKSSAPSEPHGVYGVAGSRVSDMNNLVTVVMINYSVLHPASFQQVFK